MISTFDISKAHSQIAVCFGVCALGLGTIGSSWCKSDSCQVFFATGFDESLTVGRRGNLPDQAATTERRDTSPLRRKERRQPQRSSATIRRRPAGYGATSRERAIPRPSGVRSGKAQMLRTLRFSQLRFRRNVPPCGGMCAALMFRRFNVPAARRRPTFRRWITPGYDPGRDSFFFFIFLQKEE